MAELLTKQVLFPGQNEIMQLDAITKLLGAPSDQYGGHRMLSASERMRHVGALCGLR